MSAKKAWYGILGGAIGAGLGGMLFDPIALATKGARSAGALGFGLLGMATGVAMGLVESALKDRWLYVTAGPLAGKQFILYKAAHHDRQRPEMRYLPFQRQQYFERARDR